MILRPKRDVQVFRNTLINLIQHNLETRAILINPYNMRKLFGGYVR